MQRVSARISWVFSLLVVFAATAALAQYNKPPSANPADNKLKGEYVKTGLYYFSGEGNNSILRLTANGLVVVDGKLPGNYEGLIKRVHKISDQPVRFLILTSASDASTGTDAHFLQDGTRIIAQTNTADKIKASGDESKAAPATITFDKSYEIKLGGVEVQALYYGNAHAAGDTVVYFPNLKAVAVGGLYSSSPELAGGGSLMNWSSVLDQVLKLDFDTAIPANGAPITKAELQAFKNKVDGLAARASKLVQQGVPKNELLAALNKDDHGLKLSVAPEQLDALYAELGSTKTASR